MQRLRIHHIQHVPFEGLGLIASWIDLHQHLHTQTHIYKNEILPSVNEIDVLIVMGGPMSVNDDATIAWIAAEKAFIKQAIDAGKIVMGICLGAQFIASVLGATVYKNSQKEIGWFPLQKMEISPTNSTSLSETITLLLSNQTVFHWHGETFQLPENAIGLLSSEACVNQAFLYRDSVLGLQFHVEMDETSIDTIVDNCRAELIPSEYIQTEEIIKQKMEKYVEENKKLLFELLDKFIEKKNKRIIQ